MRILYGRVFGLGNAVCAVPAIKAIAATGHHIDVLVGNGQDDVGAYDVLRHLGLGGICSNVFIDSSWDNRIPPYEYDVAIMAIPFDGRWKNGTHFRAKRVMDTRPRPEFSPHLGFSSWKKHEVEYQMELAYELGFKGETPDCSFLSYKLVPDPNRVYLGMGYKKDTAGYWKQKHWGNANFASLVNMILTNHPELSVVTSGDMLDLKLTIALVQRMLASAVAGRFTVANSMDVRSSFDLIGSCATFVGNDTGMAHIAASCGLGVVPYFKLEGASTKSRPWCKRYEVLEGAEQDVTVEQFYQAFRRVHYGED